MREDARRETDRVGDENAANAYEVAGKILDGYTQAARKRLETQRIVEDAQREADRVRDETERYFEEA